MNIFRRVVAFIHGGALEVPLVVVVLLLIGQLCWPSMMRWWQLPSPGSVGFDQFESNTLARDCVIYLPRSYRNMPSWPLVVFLHGSGERGDEPNVVRRQWPFPEKLPAIVAAPQCLPSYSWDANDVAGLVRWATSKYRVDRERIYLVGYSMGGTGAWRTAAAFSDLFAAAVPISGSGDVESAKKLARLPVWAFHGADDRVVPVGESKRMIESIRDAGGDAKLTIIPDAGHGICDSVCSRADLWQWMRAQKRQH